MYVITCYKFEFDFDDGKFNTISFVDNQTSLSLSLYHTGRISYSCPPPPSLPNRIFVCSTLRLLSYPSPITFIHFLFALSPISDFCATLILFLSFWHYLVMSKPFWSVLFYFLGYVRVTLRLPLIYSFPLLFNPVTSHRPQHSSAFPLSYLTPNTFLLFYVPTHRYWSHNSFVRLSFYL